MKKKNSFILNYKGDKVMFFWLRSAHMHIPFLHYYKVSRNYILSALNSIRSYIVLRKMPFPILLLIQLNACWFFICTSWLLCLSLMIAIHKFSTSDQYWPIFKLFRSLGCYEKYFFFKTVVTISINMNWTNL